MSTICLWGDLQPEHMPDPRSVRALTGDVPLFCNLEAPLTRRPPVGTKSVHLLASPAAAHAMRDAGVVAAHIANNHVPDAGVGGIRDTVAALRRVGIVPVGLQGPDGRCDPARIRIGGLDLIMLGYGEYCLPPLAGLDLDAMLPRVREVRARCHRLIVSLHWGIEYVTSPSPRQQEIARRLIEAGADLVAGHHPHVATGVEGQADGWIAYSLGNAALWVDEARGYPATRTGLQLLYDLSSGALRLQKLRLGERPGELALDFERSAGDAWPSLRSRWNDYLRKAGPVYLRSQMAAWRRRFANSGPGQALPLLRWLLSRTFLKMAWGLVLAVPRERDRRG